VYDISNGFQKYNCPQTSDNIFNILNQSQNYVSELMSLICYLISKSDELVLNYKYSIQRCSNHLIFTLSGDSKINEVTNGSHLMLL
jgi:hypothetical protein